MQANQVAPALVGASAVVFGYAVAGFRGIVVAGIVIVSVLLLISMFEPLQRPKGVYKPYPSMLVRSDLSPPEPLVTPREPATFADVMAPINNPDYHDQKAHRAELMTVARDPHGGNTADFESNKQWVDATNKALHEAAQLVRPDQHVVFDDDGAGPQAHQHHGAPFEPTAKLDTALTPGSRAASRSLVSLSGIPGHSEPW